LRSEIQKTANYLQQMTQNIDCSTESNTARKSTLRQLVAAEVTLIERVLALKQKNESAATENIYKQNMSEKGQKCISLIE